MVIKKIIAPLTGAALGLGFAYLSRCTGGSCNVCPLTSNLWIPAIWGGLIGYLFIM